MGNSYAGQLKSTRFEEVLHNSIEASLRSNTLVPRPIFSQLYLEAEQQLSSLEGGSRADNEEEEEDGEGGLEPSSPPNAYQLPPPPEGCCTTDGFCQAGKDLRLVSISSEPIEVPAGFLLVGAKSPSLPDHLLVCAVDKRFLPDDNGHNALLGFSGNCVGCGKKGFCYFTEFSNHINLKLTTQPKKQKHLKYYLVRNAQGALTKGPLICWKGSEFRGRQNSTNTCSSSLFPPLESSGSLAAFPTEPVPGTNPSVPVGAQQAGPASDHPSVTTATGPAVFNGKDSPKHPQLVKSSLSALPRPSALGILPNSGPPKKRHKGWSPESKSTTDGGFIQGGGNRAKHGHGNFPYLCGNLNDVVVSPLLYTCYQNSQSLARAYEQHGASTMQPISEETQLLLTVYYLVQLGEPSSAVHNIYSQSDPSVGLVDRLLNCREVKEAPNIVTLHVTSFPYALQTQHTLISPYNEIHWPISFSNGVDLYHESKKYFGLSEFIDSTLSGHSLPLLRYDSSFEAMVTALGKRFPRLHSAVIRTFVLVQHYAAAMMAVSGLPQMKNHTSVETLEITQNLLNSPKQCPCGHGLMVLLRVPCSPLAAVAYERLAHVRARLALEEHFEIILGHPSSGITVGKHFVKQLKMWQKIEDAEWRPQTYLELEGLPCILIFSGMDPHGESLPRSLRYCDLRLINSSCLVRTALEQELGLAAYFVSNDIPLEKGPKNEALESDGEKLSSTDEDEEAGTEGCFEAGSTSEQRGPVKRERSHSHDSASSSLSSRASGSVLYGESLVQPSGPPQGELTRSPPPCGPAEEGRAPGEIQRLRVSQGSTVISRHSPDLVPQPDSSLRTGRRSLQVPAAPSSQLSSSSGSSSTCAVPTANVLVLQASQCSMAKACRQPPIVFLPKLVYDMLLSTDSSGLPKSASLLPSPSVMWTSSFRPLLSKMMTSTEQSLYYRQWTVPRPSHMDYGNRAEGRVDSFHPRRLLLSGPPQIGKTGAYLQFLSILSRMLIRLTEVDVYDEEEINTSFREESEWRYLQLADPWPDLELFQKMPFDYIIHDPKYEDASLICSHPQTIKSEDRGMSRKPEDLYVRRQTARMRLSKYAAYNTYHHCEQCQQYMGFHPHYQLSESTLHVFAFSCSMLGEEVQLHFIIPKSKEHHFVFSQPGGQLESMRLPLVTDKSHEHIKSPTFTPTTGRHEHGLFNLYHAMDGANHLHVLVVKEYEMAIYKKYWPNHIMLVLPSIFNSAGVGAAHFLIKELCYHNLELERNRQEELGVKPQDVWPFIVIADDSCVMWNVADVDCAGERSREFSWSERNVSLKYIMLHIEASPNITHYALLGMRKWASKTRGREVQEPFSRCHVHDFIILNVDLTQNVQYNQNRFTCDDVDFNLRVHSAGLLLCRFNRFSVMKKQIAVGGHRSFHITSKVSDSSVAIVPSQYICAPDSKHTFLAAPAQLLLEKFLQYHSHRFFPLSLKNHSHPVLSVDCYLNLGPQISVCYVSSRPHSLNISCSDMVFSGLLLYLCDSFVGASFLKKFHFLKGATLCVICQDRNSLRQTVVRLELEDEWQFRLRDEFQTANAKEDRPLFFLTARHI
ncbi:gene regulated by estrogen in breast cancer protein [Mus musculus]|nr:gene regulated by estrogen in breast cancer protein [Mus musculus]